MKIKHWQGYGTVTAKKQSMKTDVDGCTTIEILVTGEHECGLIRDDKYDVCNWLLKKFDKRIGDNFDCYMNILDMKISSDYIDGKEQCLYKITYKL